TPVAPILFTMLAIFIFPKFLQILRDMEVPVPPLTTYVVDHAQLFAGILILAAVLVYMVALFFVLRPRLASCFRAYSFPLGGWIAYRHHWRRRRMQRDFSAMVSILLDADVDEARAVTLAAESTANQMFIRRAALVSSDLREGKSLPEAMRRFDDSG